MLMCMNCNKLFYFTGLDQKKKNNKELLTIGGSPCSHLLESWIDNAF